MVMRCQLAVFNIQFHQRFRMFGHKGHRHHHNRYLIAASPFNLAFSRRADPFQRANFALIAHHKIEIGDKEGFDQSCHARFHLNLIRVARLDDLFRQAMG